MASAMEVAIRTMLRAMDVDVEAVKAEVTSRIEKFEGNVTTLNNTLISIMEAQGRTERNLAALAAALCPEVELELPPAKNGVTANANNGNALSTIA
jgi:hypothetical protein